MERLTEYRLSLGADGQWLEPATMRHLLRTIEPVRMREKCATILERFLADVELYALPIIEDDGRPAALIERTSFVEFFTKPFGSDVFGRRSVADLLAYGHYRRSPPLVVEEDCTVEDGAQMIISAGMQHMVAGFIVCRAGRYRGVANGRDLLNVITQRKQEQLYRLAHYDALTGIPNRALLADRLELACRMADRTGLQVGLLFIDVDRFKHINDSMGHSAGDEVLRLIVGRLRGCVRQMDTLARLAGDEFVIVMERLSDPMQVDVLAHRILGSMREPFEVGGHSLFVTVSIGSAIYPRDDGQLRSLMVKADAAMYESKASGRNSFRSYTPKMLTFNPESISLENDMRRALERDEFVLHFQPQVDLATGQLRGAEALVRWRHPERGLVSPMHFIPVAEESGLIVQIGECVLRKALAQVREWHDQGLPLFRVSVNISALQFRQANFARFIETLLAEHGVSGEFLELELTESILMRDVEDVLDTLNAIKSLGVRLAIDDFGTGFSCLSYLRRFPIDCLKIDQSFVRNIERTPINQSIAQAIVALGESLALGVIAEGVETLSEAAVLKGMRCSQAQGYLYSTPLEPRSFARWLANRNVGRAVAPAA
ncbi:putative bifunctional diguanylate cyclase/phosphodiesterase [Thauera sinica]|uniref:Bifunctional diguanylate cyclase/phosphodiesterase n=1 Tax=Thauera sinica TaxID=2665146 RepID=A0ABW1APC0_9RHOO|nr:EAL domain-containing protein [Thauera sp. K11]ATE60518.1 diguanylate cyclase [Thauera sp. K11]